MFRARLAALTLSSGLIFTSGCFNRTCENGLFSRNRNANSATAALPAPTYPGSYMGGAYASPGGYGGECGCAGGYPTSFEGGEMYGGSPTMGGGQMGPYMSGPEMIAPPGGMQSGPPPMMPGMAPQTGAPPLAAPPFQGNPIPVNPGQNPPPRVMPIPQAPPQTMWEAPR